MDVVLCVASRREVLKGGGVPGRGGSKSEPDDRVADFFLTRLDCAGVAQTHFRRIIAFRERVIMQARAPISTFSIFLCFSAF